MLYVKAGNQESPVGTSSQEEGVGAEQSVTSWALGRMMISAVPARDAYWEPFVDPVAPSE